MTFHPQFEQTPNSSKTALCDSCRFAIIIRGSNGEKQISCSMLSSDASFIRMKVVDCTRYLAKNAQSLQEMEEAAWILGTKKVVGLAGGRSDEETKVTWSKPEDRAQKQGIGPSAPETSR